MPHFDAEDLIATAHALADAARAATLAHFRAAALGVENKAAAGFDPVTLADREAEAAMRAVLAARRPDDAILGEELDHVAGRSGCRPPATWQPALSTSPASTASQGGGCWSCCRRRGSSPQRSAP